MAILTRYIQISDRLLLEYQANKSLELEESGFVSLYYHTPYVVKDLQGNTMFLDNPSDSKVKEEYKSDLHFQGFTDKYGVNYYYPGFSDFAQGSGNINALLDYGKIASIEGGPFYNGDLPYDTIRIHILTGYVFNDVEGFNLKVKAKQRRFNKNTDSSVVNINNTEAIISSFVFHKGIMGKVVEFNPNPVYMSERFYDRFIEFKIPSVYTLALNNPNKKNQIDSSVINPTESEIEINKDLYSLMDLSQDSEVIFEFSNIEEDSFTPKVLLNTGTYEGEFHLGSTIRASLPFNSNADYFNVTMQEQDNGLIKYGAVWGSPNSKYITYINNSIMNNIESGAIPMYSTGFKDDNDGWEDFSEIYGTEARHWVIVHDLFVNYKYYAIESSQTDTLISREERFNFTEGFTSNSGNETNGGYSYKFRPVISHIQNYECKVIDIQYTARLLNRMNGATISRTSSISIDEAESKFGEDSYRLNMDNLMSWTIFNKQNIMSPKIDSGKASNVVTKYIKEFFDTSLVQMADTASGTYYNTNDVELMLYSATHNYKFQLVYNDSKTGNLRYLDLSGPYTYVLRFKDSAGNNIDCTPTYSKNMNLALGEIEFKVDESAANKILQVAEEKRKFYLICLNSDGSSSAMFSGKIQAM
jgi:hypothetical protein